MDERFSRTERLLGAAAMQRLAAANVAVFGVGGVGGYVVEALARSGVGTLHLIDGDVVSPSNLNRQIIALEDTVGTPKVEAAAARVAKINPACRLICSRTFVLPENIGQFDFSTYSYVVDAIDTVSGKLAIVQAATDAGVPVISAMGAGNKLNPTRFEVADIYKTTVDPLARVMRYECRRRGIEKLKVVYSTEPPLAPASPEEPPADGAGARRSVPGSLSFVPSVAGLILAGEVVRDLISSDFSASDPGKKGT